MYSGEQGYTLITSVVNCVVTLDLSFGETKFKRQFGNASLAVLWLGAFNAAAFTKPFLDSIDHADKVTFDYK